MSRRRSSGDGDSLELLLDTICNMFGVIIVAALIAAILALARPPRPEEPPGEDPSAKAAAELDGLRERVRRLEDELARLPAPEASIETEEETERLERARDEVARRLSLTERYRKAIANLREGPDAATVGAESLRQEIARLQESLDAARRAKEREVRTPMERELDLNLFIIVVWQDRLYPICDLTNRPADRCEWLRQWNDRYVVAARCRTPVFRCGGLDGADIRREIQFRPEAGIPLADPIALRTHPEAIALLASLDRNVDLIGLEVSPDSFDSFAIAKDFFLANGFQYYVEPCEDPLPSFRDSWISGRPRGM